MRWLNVFSSTIVRDPGNEHGQLLIGGMGAGAVAGEAYAVPEHSLESSDSLSTFNSLPLKHGDSLSTFNSMLEGSISGLAESFQLRKPASKFALSFQAQGSKRKLRPIASLDDGADDDDWIAVEDDDDPLEDSVAMPRRRLLQKNPESFRVTESGTIELRGGAPVVTSHGLGARPRPEDQFSVVDRCVLLEPASSDRRGFFA